MRGKLIGLVGYQGVGKTTIVKKAIERGPALVVQMGFSNPIIDMLAALGISHKLLGDKTQWEKPVPILKGRTIRYAAQTLGTEWGRNCIDQDLWTAIAIERANAWRMQGWHVIIDNCRFPSEFDALTAAGAHMIAVNRPGIVTFTKHESEQHINALQERCMITLVNDGTLAKVVHHMGEIMLDVWCEPVHT